MESFNVNDNCYLLSFFVFALIETLLCSGITYGWASIVYVFKTEHFYMDLCKEWYEAQNKTLPSKYNLVTSLPVKSSGYPEIMRSINYTIVGGGVVVDDGKLPGCPAQDAQLNLIFTVSLFCLCGIKFPAGVFIDRFGPRIARSVGGLLYIAACLGLGFVSIGYENFLFPVFAFICMGGSLLVVAVYQVSNIIFRHSRSRVMCILHGAFDSSAVVLLVFKLIYDRGVEYKHVIFVYTAICLLLILFGTFILIPKLSVLYEWIEEEKRLHGYALTRRMSISGPDFVVNSLGWNGFSNISYAYGSVDSHVFDEGMKAKRLTSISSNEEEEDGKKFDQEIEEQTALIECKQKTRFKEGSVLNSIFSPLYLFELIYLMTFQLKLWYFVGSLADFLGRLTLNDKTQVSKYVDIFGYVQFGGICMTPFIGLIYGKDRLGKGGLVVALNEKEGRIKRLSECIAPFAVTNLLCIVFCIVSSLENLNAQVVSFVLYTIVRGFLYSNHGAYMGATFPPSQFGTLYGLGIFIGGTFGILQYVLFKITAGPLRGDPFWVNMFLLCLVMLGNIHPIHLWWYCKKERKKLNMQ